VHRGTRERGRVGHGGGEDDAASGPSGMSRAGGCGGVVSSKSEYQTAQDASLAETTRSMENQKKLAVMT
jgi:hypothetical protein